MVKNFLSLTKPGIIFGNLITVAGGFFLGARGIINDKLFCATLLGISLIIGAGCVFNNFIDQDIDKIMERTKNRVLVRGLISGSTALIYAIVLSVLGVIVLYSQTNHLTVSIALVGLFVYVVIYSLWLKRKSVYGTLVGSISGAVPPVVGYCAVTNRFDIGAIVLFFILALWQMPHSYAIAIYRLNDYKAAHIPVLPVEKGIYIAKLHMLFYILAFFLVSLMLNIFGYTGVMYLVIVGVAGAFWIWMALKGFKAKNDKNWARKMFLFSIIIITLLAVMMSVDAIRV